MAIPMFSRPTHVLIVDDDATNRLVESKICQLFGATSEAACDGEEAIELCGKHAYDLVLMDIRMPLMDGIETSYAIRNLPGRGGEVPIIAVTGDQGETLRQLCYAAGMSTLLPKPIVIQTLFNAMESALAQGCIGVTPLTPELSAAAASR